MKKQIVEGKGRGNSCQVGCEQGYRSTIFKSLSDEEFAELEALMTRVEYKEGDLIFQEGSLADGIDIVCKGIVQYGKHSDSGKGRKQILKLVGPGEILGEETFFTEGPCSHFGYARTLVDTQVAFLEKDAFLSFLKEHPNVLLDLWRRFAKEIIILEHKLMRCTCETTDENLALLLLNLGSRYGVREGSRLQIALDLKQTILADILGISVDSLARTLGKLKERKMISFQNRKIVILDEERLEELATPPLFLEGTLL